MFNKATFREIESSPIIGQCNLLCPAYLKKICEPGQKKIELADLSEKKLCDAINESN